MLNMVKRFQAKEWFIITILMLFITDLVIILDLPIIKRYYTIFILYHCSWISDHIHIKTE